jgi:hypothetical protein
MAPALAFLRTAKLEIARLLRTARLTERPLAFFGSRGARPSAGNPAARRRHDRQQGCGCDAQQKRQVQAFLQHLQQTTFRKSRAAAVE